MSETSTPKERVEFGLDTIPPDRMVTVKLCDLMYVHKTLAEFNKFFHQPMHYTDLASVERFLGARNSGGAYDVLSEALYKRIREMLPPDIDDAFDGGERFEHPLPPEYFKDNDAV